MDFEIEIKKELKKILKKGVKLEIPPDSRLGDYSFPCFELAKEFKKDPNKIAKELSEKIINKNFRVENKGPYLNFFIDKEVFALWVIKGILNTKGLTKKKGKIILEHTSVNPNASPHVGRARNSIIGDSIKRILEFNGYKIETHYYVNDVSKQIAILALNFNSKNDFNDLLRIYVEVSKKIEENPELEKKVFELLNKFEKKDKKTVALFRKIVDIAVKGQKKIFSSIGINFDYFDYESDYINSSREVLKQLEKTGKLFKDEEGRMVLDQSGTRLEVKMKSPVLVLTRNDGTGLYPLRDLAYTLYKCKKGKNVIVLGEDQKLYFEQLKQALISLKRSYPEVVHYSFVLLKDVGKMSTRRGEVVLLDEFIGEAVKKAEKEIEKRKTKGDKKKIGIGAIKYAMLRNENNKNIIFDLEQALSFEGNSGPYLQYSYVRAASILKKARKKSNFKIVGLKEKEIELIKKLDEFKVVVEQASSSLNPSLIANYSFQLAQIFNEFYHLCPVIGSAEEGQRLAIVKAFLIVMKSSLWLLGIEVMEEM
ncbi:arginine--tRNA ligase [Candidatus Woesearchaeota archaeon]|nr:arginine--tRNA ligase [Candidatus Woesearchaeota archaeon]